MKIEGQTILITGGSSGIGLALAQALVERGNKILICGRSLEKLEAASRAIPGIRTFQCDLAMADERVRLSNWVKDNHPSCNVLVNNAAVVHRGSFHDDDDIIEKAEMEMQINFFAPIHLIKLMLPILLTNKNSSVVNVTTGLVYVPRAAYPIYPATKSALHAFTQGLRFQLRNSPLRIVEVLMTVVNTPWHDGNPPPIAISPNEAANEMISGLERGKTEIRISRVKRLYFLSRVAPKLAFRLINRL
jgi:uncharacterized oxidoreductase